MTIHTFQNILYPLIDCLIITLVIIFSYIISLVLKRFWIFNINKNGIYGSDYQFFKSSKEKKRRLYFLTEFVFKNTMSWEEIENKINSSINNELKNKKSSMRFGCSWDKKKFYLKSNIKSQDIIEYIYNDKDFYSIEDKKNREVIYRIYPKKQLVGVLFDHVCFDGLRFFNEIIKPVFETKQFTSQWMNQKTYTVFLTELKQLYTMSSIIKRNLKQKTLPLLQDDKQIIIQHELINYDIKNIRR